MAWIDYTHKVGKVVTLPCVTVPRPRDNKVAGFGVSIDTAPIHA